MQVAKSIVNLRSDFEKVIKDSSVRHIYKTFGLRSALDHDFSSVFSLEIIVKVCIRVSHARAIRKFLKIRSLFARFFEKSCVSLERGTHKGIKVCVIAIKRRFQSPGDRLGKRAPRCSGRGAGSNFCDKYQWICTFRAETELIQKSGITFYDTSQLILKVFGCRRKLGNLFS